jgi:two-component system copper resistance phosphate regulon response regulator CusR
MKILVVEDELNLASFLKRGLEEEGYQVDMALDAKTAKVSVATEKFDLLVMDVILPDGNGMKLCHDFKELHPKMPIILLTSLGQVNEKVAGLDSGADDYLVKPFQFTELTARIRAIERRMNHYSTPATLAVSNLVMDIGNHKVIRSGKEIALTAREFKLLQVFLENKNRVMNRLEIAESVWDINFDTGTNVVDVYVNYLRNKIDRNFEPKLIHTVVGVGYVLRSE